MNNRSMISDNSQMNELNAYVSRERKNPGQINNNEQRSFLGNLFNNRNASQSFFN